jgi:hypothetical protein
MITFATLNFTKDVLLSFATHYPTSFRKALVINAPPFVGGAWKLVSTVLPKNVKDKVSIPRERGDVAAARQTPRQPAHVVLVFTLSLVLDRLCVVF